MKKTKNKIKVGLYNPYLDTLGGGEKHILSILQVFAEENGEINIFWDKNLSSEIKKRFSLDYVNKINWLPSIKTLGTLKTLKMLFSFDYFFYVTDGSYFFSTAKNNFIFCMIPDKKLYNLNLINKLKLLNYKFISNSFYTTTWLKKWQINPITIPPYIEENFFNDNIEDKEKIILSVGRFFPHLHSKNQEKIIKTFQKLKKNYPLFKDYKLILAGGLKKEDENYFYYLKSLTENNQSIIFKTNISFNEICQLYKKATYFWHFTGLDVDEKKSPDKVEHFGIAPLEAMASGCLTFAHNSGGPKIIIKNQKTGLLFKNENDLIKKMIYLETNKILKEKIIKNSVKYIKENFNYQKFKEKIIKNLL